MQPLEQPEAQHHLWRTATANKRHGMPARRRFSVLFAGTFLMMVLGDALHHAKRLEGADGYVTLKRQVPRLGTMPICPLTPDAPHRTAARANTAAGAGAAVCPACTGATCSCG